MPIKSSAGLFPLTKSDRPKHVRLADFSLRPTFLDKGESGMNIDRRRLLSATACLTLTGMVGDAPSRAGTDAKPVSLPWHPLTRSLLDRARRANCVDGRADTASVERLRLRMAGAQACASPPVIKWLADSSGAFDHLSGYGLDALLQRHCQSLAPCRAVDPLRRSIVKFITGPWRSCRRYRRCRGA
jgi:hypothetical protein